MLDNEPAGGERPGNLPAGDTAETTVSPPVRRARTTRRKAVPPPGEPTAGEPTAGDLAAGGPAAGTEPGSVPTDPSGSTPTDRGATATATAGDGDGLSAAQPPAEAPAKATRRRRKTAAAVAGDDAVAGGDAAPARPAALAVPAGAPTAAVESAPQSAAGGSPDDPAPVKATRVRRKKAAAPAADPTAGDPTAGDPTAGDLSAAEPGGEQTPVDPTPPDVAASTTAPTRVGRARRPATDPGFSSAGGIDVPAPAEPLAQPGAELGTADALPSVPTARADAPAAEATPDEAPRARRRQAASLPPAVLFMPPEPETTPSARTTTSRRDPGRQGGTASDETLPGTDDLDLTGGFAEPAETSRRRRRGRRTGEAVDAEAELPEALADELPAVLDEPDDTADDVEDDEDIDDGDDAASARRRRRRGRRGRGRGKGPTDDEDEGDESAVDPAAEGETGEASGADDEDDDEDDGEAVTRRRRRRRRKGAGDADTTAAPDDGVHTVVRIREPRPVRDRDEVQGVSGSTRLEAKRQRRRDGREQRRTRPPILSESEFLARREAVDRVMVVRQKPDRTQIAVLEDGVLVEHYVTRATSGTMVGNVYLGKVQNVLPSMEAAFVDVGRGRNAVLYAGEVNWDATGLEGRARSIEQALKSGDSVLVQVTKDPIGHKGARLSSHIALSGRHLVYVPNGNASGISRKLPDNERKRLRDILKKMVPDGAGVIVRTAAEGASEDELARDVKRLQAQWEDIQAKAAEGGAPTALSEEPDLVIRVVRDLFNEDFRDLVVQGDESYDMVEAYLSHVSPDLLARLRRHTGVGDVFAEKRIDEQILKGLDRKVFLPSGGHLVIDRTEAMTVVDVNTGKYTGVGGNLEETVTRNNLEAAEEIVRQLRLRDLGGIVVIDFIDMVLESNRELVLRRLTECLGRDRTKHQVTEITSLGLVQMTRKRIGAGLLEAFSETCEHCKGRGLMIHTEPVPERNRPAGADRVRAVASAPTRSEPATGRSEPTATRSEPTGRRRGRRTAEPADAVADGPDDAAPQESGGGAVVPEAAVTRVPVAAADPDDTMGYDLSRYEVASSDDEDDEPMRLTGSDDPDAVDGELDDGEEPVGAGTGARRRSRRGGTRRRTRP